MIATEKWFSSSAAAFRANDGHAGVADLLHYNAHFCQWGRGRPIILVPGLAGGYDLLGPLARELARHYHVISYQLRGEGDVLRTIRETKDLDDATAADLNAAIERCKTMFGVEAA